MRAGLGRLLDAAGSAMDTKSWVTARAAADSALLHLIVDNVRALDHLVRCIHLDPEWEGKCYDNYSGGGNPMKRNMTY